MAEDNSFLNKITFFKSVTHIKELPHENWPEISFIGRSNVGKSSLLNALTSRKNIARVSNTPGRTQQLNFFNINDKLWLVDLPGYGYAKAPLKEINKWNKLTKDYFYSRPNLIKTFVLVDSRHGLKKNDIDIIDYFNLIGNSFVIILTKTDLVKKNHLEKLVADIENYIQKSAAAYPQIFSVSSKKKFGINELKKFIKGQI